MVNLLYVNVENEVFSQNAKYSRPYKMIWKITLLLVPKYIYENIDYILDMNYLFIINKRLLRIPSNSKLVKSLRIFNSLFFKCCSVTIFHRLVGSSPRRVLEFLIEMWATDFFIGSEQYFYYFTAIYRDFTTLKRL